MSFVPTAEQTTALDLFGTGEDLVIQARAGAGKTSTLKLLADSTSARGQYLAFNRSIVQEAGEKMPRNVTASTVHSLAFRSYGHRYKHRLNSKRMRSNDLARLLGLDPFVVTYGGQRKVLAAGFLAGHVMKAIERFCQSADEEPTERHVAYIDGIDLPNDDGTRTYENNDLVAEYLVGSIREAWQDLTQIDGSLPFGHHVYLKGWQLTSPQIPADFILLDEAQDVAPVMYAIFEGQENSQLIAVGDDAQEIYAFTGAINAMGRMEAKHRTVLSQSFRFGPAIADIANRVLDLLGSDRLVGTDEIASTVGPLAEPDCILTRTNAVAVENVLVAQRAGRRPHLMGGGYEVVSFARAARDLQGGRSTEHRDLACFSSWGEVQEYVDQDAQGEDLRLMVKLVDEFGVQTILDALDNMAPESAADVVISTAHKSKGREWRSVQLAGDFNRSDLDGNLRRPEPEELRLLYVAATRAQIDLDVDAVRMLSTVESEARVCPFCDRSDVVRSNGVIGAHRCEDADRLPALFLEGIDG
jgi:superfamily I DNA/RNA helicase